MVCDDRHMSLLFAFVARDECTKMIASFFFFFFFVRLFTLTPALVLYASSFVHRSMHGLPRTAAAKYSTDPNF